MLNQALEKLGLQIESAQGALVDATMIESNSRLRKEIIVSVDRKEDAEAETNPPMIEINESKDPDGRWIKKGNKNQRVKLNKLINWEQLRGYLSKIHKNENHHLGGPTGYDPLKMFKALLLGQ